MHARHGPVASGPSMCLLGRSRRGGRRCGSRRRRVRALRRHPHRCPDASFQPSAAGTISARLGELAPGLISAKPRLGLGGLLEAVKARCSCVGKFHGSRHSEARAAEDRDREIPDQVCGLGHACLGEHDDDDVVGEALDVAGDVVEVASWCPASNSSHASRHGASTSVALLPAFAAAHSSNSCRVGASVDSTATTSATRPPLATALSAIGRSMRTTGVSISRAPRSADPPSVEHVQTIPPGSCTVSSRRHSRTRASMPASTPRLRASLSKVCVYEVHIRCCRRDFSEQRAERCNVHICGTQESDRDQITGEPRLMLG
jgi:hypothetical protein